MPEVVAGWVAGWVASWFSGAIVTSWAASAAYAVAYVGTAVVIGAGMGRLARSFAPKLPSGGLNSGSPLQMGRDPITPRRVIYGRTRVSGPMVFAHVAGASNEYLHLVVPLAGHECEAIEDVYLNDEVVPFDGSGNATGEFAGFARVRKHLGEDSQSADTDLVAEAPGYWTANHRLRGICYLYLRLKFDQTKFPGGIPNVSAVVKGRRVYDPRTSTTAWSANVAVCIRDYLTHSVFGLAVDAATEIDEASFIAAANTCDEDVSLAAGGAENRYEAHGSFELAAEPGTVLDKLTGAMAGLITYVGGKWTCHAGAHRTPTITLDEDDLRGAITVQTKASLRDTCNRVRGTYPAPGEKWQPADYPPVVNATYLAEDGGLEIWRDMELPFTNSPSMCQRLAKIELERTRQDITVSMPCKLTALRAQAGDVVMVNNTRWGWSSKQFMVEGLKFAVYDSGGAPALGVDLALRETASGIWDWSNGEETTYDLAANTNLINPRSVPTPTGLTLSTSNFQQADGTIGPRLRVQVNAVADAFITSGGFLEIEYKKSADPTWLVWNPALRGDAAEEFITDVLAGVSYDVRTRYRNRLGVTGSYASASHTVSKDQTAPATPTGLTATGTPRAITLDWDDNTESDLAFYRVYRHTSNDPGAATLIATALTSRFVDTFAAQDTPYWYWVAAVDRTNNASAKSTTASGTAVMGTAVRGSVFVDVVGFGDTSWDTIAQVGIAVASGEEVMVTASGGEWTNETEPPAAKNFSMRIVRGSTVIAQFTQTLGAGASSPFHLTGTETPGAGDHTYEVQAKGGDASTLGSVTDLTFAAL